MIHEVTIYCAISLRFQTDGLINDDTHTTVIDCKKHLRKE